MDDPFPGTYLLAALISGPEISFLAINLALIILLFVGSALVSGSEVAYFSLSLDQVISEGDDSPHNKRIIHLLTNPNKLLATILILNNFINISIVMITTYATLRLTAPYFSPETVLGILTITITFLIVFIGEIVPKVYANQNNWSFAQKTSKLLSISNDIFSPLSWLLIKVSHVLETRIERKGYNVSVEELNEALEITTNKETTEEEKGILKGIVNFGTLSVKQIMKSRMDITALDIQTDFHELMNQINKTGYSRIPIYKETIDNIEGILYIKDLLPNINGDENYQWQDLLRPGFFVPETKKIDTLFKDFQERRIHIAIVVDEYGGTSGLITMEDVIEEIVGEINDEFDEETDAEFKKIDANTFIFEGKTSIMDFCKITNVDHRVFEEVKGESESLGGLLLEINATLPYAGEKIIFDRYTFVITSVNEKRIKKIRVVIKR
ncbi:MULTISPECIES: gliding motility-associated protein GldE [Reichenbachiella]|uniref:gliding motility-associated protein GldE n=1 Tax=Reichenbachiella TaxID=156993 RepID=UPI000E6C9259|nr:MULTISPECIES: gliding motility-associated protein GldE [Reichenbachiella]MBU2915977.1 gliding motility-associated protein GldE [Reichenbachiella agariperforans]RJE71784.1 magnesium/cobalt efflux protein [Reichenbachiella sp. MSK19-1]